MAVITNAVGRGDISFALGTSFRWRIRWTRQANGVSEPVDLTAWTMRLQVYGAQGQLWLDKDVTDRSAQGVAFPELKPSDTSGVEWKARRSGVWRIVASQPDGDALTVRWSGAQDASTSLLSTMPDLSSGEVQEVAWGYWRAG